MNDITHKACAIMKKAGAAKVFLFGSRANGTAEDSSDYDFGVVGLPPSEFFKTWGCLENELNIKADLVDFDAQPDFYAMLQNIGELKFVG